jgi:hypothetical protein
MTIILPLACSYAPGLAFIYFCPYSVIDVTVVTKLSTAAHENAHLQSKFIITIYDEFYATVASRARLRSPHMVRVFHAADGDPHALCNTTLSSAAAAARIVMAGWKAIGWIYSWIKQIKFTVHRRVLSATGCYPPRPPRCSMELPDLRSLPVWLKRDDFLQSSLLDMLG